MRVYITSVLLLFFVSLGHAQNTTEAKMAYQLAEEKFEAKNYDEALELLKKAETALGSVNPPIAYLRVMIVSQLAYSKESGDNYDRLEKAITDFDVLQNKEGLGDDKLMEIYRVKTDFEQRKISFNKEVDRTTALQKSYEEMINRWAASFPKTGIIAEDFIASIPPTWADHNMKQKQRNRQIENIIAKGEGGYSGLYVYPSEEQFYVREIKTYGPGKNKIKTYHVNKRLKTNNKKKNKTERMLTVEEICEFLKISPKQWNDLTAGENPLIWEESKGTIEVYRFIYPKQKVYYEGDRFIDAAIYKETIHQGTYMHISIFRNSL